MRAAGGVVLREGRVVVVHRPKYDDWTLPKGKLDPGESFEQAAVREVQEETGLACRVAGEPADHRYVDDRGRPKLVRYWAMELVADEGFSPNDEVDELHWIALEDLDERLTYDTDAEIARRLCGGGRT